MSPLQKIALGLMVVFGSALVPAHPSPAWERYDALPDPLGWVLVVLGAAGLSRADHAFSTARLLAVLAGVVSVPMWFPVVQHRLDDSGAWFLSLPQIAFCLVLAREIALLAARQDPQDAYANRRFGLLVWGFAVVAVLPVLTLGGGLTALRSTTLAVSTLVDVAFVYFLFRVHRRRWLGGPGPLLIEARGPLGERRSRPSSE